MEKKSDPETLTPVTSHIAVHKDGDHECVVPFETVQDGQDTRGRPLFVRRDDGSYERVTGLRIHPRAGAGGDVGLPGRMGSDVQLEGW